MIEESWLIDAVGNAIASLTKRRLAVDVGANIGDWSRELCGIFDRVEAFEPDQRASAKIEPRENLTLHLAAVCDRDGEVTFHLRPDPAQNSILEKHPIGAGGQSEAPVVQSIAVPCVSLDAGLPEGADFVKIDIEGGEVAALDGCRDPTRWRRTAFIVECHNTATDVQKRLLGLGKRIQYYGHPSPTAHPGHCWLIGLPPSCSRSGTVLET